MKRRIAFRPLMCLAVASVVASAACSRDPEIAKRAYLASGDAYAAQEKLNEAAVEYRNAIQQDPLFGEARFKLAGIYVRLGDASSAFREYVRAADLLVDDPEAQVRATEMLLLAGRFEEARARADKALALDPKHVVAQILRGNALAGLKDLDAAVKEMEQALTLDPEQSVAYSNLGTLELARGNRAEAEEAFSKAIQIDPRSVLARLSLANFYWATGRSADTERILREAHGLSPEDLLANRSLAMFFLASGRAAEAEPYIQAVVRVTQTSTSKLWLADYYWTLQRRADAEKLLTQLEADKSVASQAKLRLASIAVNDNDLDAAKALLNEVVQENPRSIDALVARAHLLLRERRLDEALDQAQAAAKIDARSHKVQLALGHAWAARHEWDSAIAAFTEATSLAPRAISVRLALARAHLAKGDAREAVRVAQEAVSLQSRNADARLMLVRALIATREVGTAQSHLKTLLEAAPNAPPVLAQLGSIQALMKNTPAARRAFEQALAGDPKQLDALAGLVALDLDDGRPAAAVARIESALASMPDDAAMLILAARAYLAVRDAPAAEKALRRSVEVDPSNVLAFQSLGRLYASQGRLDQARAEFERVATARPNDVSAHTLVAMMHQAQGNTVEARARYQKALDLNPNGAVAANNLAWLLAETGENLDVALQWAQTAKAQLPENPEVNDTLGAIYLKKGLPTLAIPPLRQSVSAAPNNAGYHYQLSLAYARSGDAANARRSLTRARQLDPDDDRAQLVMTALAAASSP
jgi:Tfp pilus assembly protein PilF